MQPHCDRCVFESLNFHVFDQIENCHFHIFKFLVKNNFVAVDLLKVVLGLKSMEVI